MADQPHQCPHCDLRFLDTWEVREHITTDHPEHVPVEADDDA